MEKDSGLIILIKRIKMKQWAMQNAWLTKFKIKIKSSNVKNTKQWILIK